MAKIDFSESATAFYITINGTLVGKTQKVYGEKAMWEMWTGLFGDDSTRKIYAEDPADARSELIDRLIMDFRAVIEVLR